MLLDKFLEVSKDFGDISVFAGVSILVYNVFLQRLLSQLRYYILQDSQQCLRTELPVYNCSYRLHVVCTPEDWDLAYSELTQSLSLMRVVGLDCEWVSNGRTCRPVSLIQMATSDKLVILVRMFLLREVPDTLKTFLADKSVYKVGVAVNDDASRLFTNYGLHVNGCVDLRYLVTRVRLYKCENNGLGALTEQILCCHLPKPRSVRCGNWEADELNPEQITYAAKDALSSIDIFIRLMVSKIHKRIATESDILNTSSTDVTNIAKSTCQGLIDVPYKATKKDASRKKNETRKGQSSYQQQKRPASHSYSVRSKPLFYKCKLLAPDGQPLCVTNESKAQWYLDKNLADKVSDDPLTVKLKFEPSGRPVDEDDYYLVEKDNICVVCGASKSYNRKLVVPHEYRKFFPDAMKEHSSHDVLLLCPECHARCALHDSRIRQYLVTKCDAPLNSGSSSNTFIDSALSKVKSAGRALKLNGDKIPLSRRNVLEDNIKEFYGVTEISNDVIEMAASINIKQINGSFIPHGQKVVQHYTQYSTLWQLEKLWRQHFLDSMQPAFMPTLWSVSHGHHE